MRYNENGARVLARRRSLTTNVIGARSLAKNSVSQDPISRRVRRLVTTRGFAAALLALAIPAFAAEVQFIPLQDYIGQPGVEKDPAALGYVAERCSALYTVFAKGLEQETDPERQKVKNQALNAGEKFMGVAVQSLRLGTTIELKDAMIRTRNIVVEVGNLYTDRIEAARVRAGDMFADPLILVDLGVCKGLLPKL